MLAVLTVEDAETGPTAELRRLWHGQNGAPGVKIPFGPVSPVLHRRQVQGRIAAHTISLPRAHSRQLRFLLRKMGWRKVLVIQPGIPCQAT